MATNDDDLTSDNGDITGDCERRWPWLCNNNGNGTIPTVMALNGLESLYGLDMRRSEEMTAADIMETDLKVVPCKTTVRVSGSIYNATFGVVFTLPQLRRSGWNLSLIHI